MISTFSSCFETKPFFAHVTKTFDSTLFSIAERKTDLAHVHKMLETISAQEAFHKMGQLVLLLAEHKGTLHKTQAIEILYPGYSKRSLVYQESILASFHKVMQRARARYKHLGISIDCGRYSQQLTLQVKHQNNSQIHHQSTI